MSDKLKRVSHYGTITIGDIDLDGVILDDAKIVFAESHAASDYGFIFNSLNDMHRLFSVDKEDFFNLLSAARYGFESYQTSVEGLAYIPFCIFRELLELILFTNTNGECAALSSVSTSSNAFVLLQFDRLSRTNFTKKQLQIEMDFTKKANPRARRSNRKNSVVYFIEAGNLIKIGVTQEIDRRMRQLQIGCPHQIKLLKTIPGCRDVELKLHDMFNGSRVNGEWFNKSPDLMSYIFNT